MHTIPISRHPDMVVVSGAGTYGAGDTPTLGAYETAVAYRYGNSHEDIYCAPCAMRRNNLAAARPLTLDDIAAAAELECSFCGDVI